MAEPMTLSASPEAFAALLDGRNEFLAPAKILAEIPAADALRIVPGLPHSIATQLSHLQWWQQRRLRALRGELLDYADDFVLGVTDFPPVTADAWDQLRADFLTSFEELRTLSRDTAKMAAMNFEDRDGGFLLASHALHNAYHLGQIVLMRRLLNIWPPPPAVPEPAG